MRVYIQYMCVGTCLHEYDILSGSFAATDMNDRSSRSHVIFTITVECCDLGADKQQHVRMGKLHLVDLAVSVCVCVCVGGGGGNILTKIYIFLFT